MADTVEETPVAADETKEDLGTNEQPLERKSTLKKSDTFSKLQVEEEKENGGG